jgi:HEPN domain-containing protein
VLFTNGKYSSALFFCHLSVEKLVKALVVRATNTHAPYEHNLLKLVDVAGMHLPPERDAMLAEINSFNIGGRYDDYKATFYKKATQAFATEWMQSVKELRIWLIAQ